MPKKKPSPSDLTDQFLVRMPDGLRGRIAVAAFENRRSMNAEVIATLEAAYPELDGLEEVESNLRTILMSYKDGSNTRWDRTSIRGLLQTIVLQLAHDTPPDKAPTAARGPSEE